MPWSSLGVSGRLTVGDFEFDGVMAAIAFELNAVPRAVFAVEIGRGKGSLTPATIHRAARRMRAEDRVQFFLKLTPLGGQTQNVPEGEFRLFDGYLTGISAQKLQGNAQVLLQAQHWLLDMDYSSALSDTSHPTNPSQFTYRSAHVIPGAGGASWTPFTEQGLITPDTLANDFWDAGLKRWLRELTQMDLINSDEIGAGGGGGNDTAARALSRFTTGSGNYVPLALDMRGADAPSVAEAIWNDVQLETYEAFANTTLWGKLVGDFGSRYMFAVCPRVEDALVVPYIPGLRKDWKHGIATKDYASIAMSSELLRLLRGVGVFSGLKSRTGADAREPGGDSPRLGIGGWYSPGLDRGMIMLRQGPRWLNNVIASDRYSAGAAGSGVEEIGTAFHPGTGKASDKPPPSELKESTKPLLDAFAEALYVNEQLRLRQMEVSGKARFDIAPGSTIGIDVADEPFIRSDALAGRFYGDVIRVTYMIDSENARIATNFNIAHVRTTEENSAAGFSLSRHPLWKNPWSGAGLLAEFD